MNGPAGTAISNLPQAGFGNFADAAERRMRRLIVGMLLVAWLTAHALLRWWPQFTGQLG
jgi:hypothetical protein